MTEFKKPIFKNKHIEMRFEDGEVCIYATKSGLEKLSVFCKMLVTNPQKGHLHLEDYDVLTENSLKGTIAIFTAED